MLSETEWTFNLTLNFHVQRNSNRKSTDSSSPFQWMEVSFVGGSLSWCFIIKTICLTYNEVHRKQSQKNITLCNNEWEARTKGGPYAWPVTFKFNLSFFMLKHSILQSDSISKAFLFKSQHKFLVNIELWLRWMNFLPQAFECNKLGERRGEQLKKANENSTESCENCRKSKIGSMCCLRRTKFLLLSFRSVLEVSHTWVTVQSLTVHCWPFSSLVI